MNISIIIINFNALELTSACIRSVIEHTQAIDYEIILIDNASTECNPDVFIELFPSIKLIKSDKNLGFSSGNNLGIKHSKYDYILLLNNDTILINNAIKLSVEKIEKDSKIGALSCKLQYPNGTYQHPAQRFPSIKTELREIFRLNKILTQAQRADLYLDTHFDHLTERECDWIWGAFFLTRRSIIEKLGGKLPDTFFMYAEDVQWCWRIKKMGYKINYFPDAQIIHYLGSSIKADNAQTKYFKYLFPNTFKVVATEKHYCYAWLLYFVKALHLLTLRNRKDFKTSMLYLKFLFGKKNYWLNENSTC